MRNTVDLLMDEAIDFGILWLLLRHLRVHSRPLSQPPAIPDPPAGMNTPAHPAAARCLPYWQPNSRYYSRERHSAMPASGIAALPLASSGRAGSPAPSGRRKTD